MAIKKESLKAILLTLKVGDEKAIDEMIAAEEEKEVKIPDGTKIFSGDEYTKLEANLNKASINAGKEIGIKELKEATGLDFEGKKPEAFLEAYKKKVLEDANIKPEEKIKEKEAVITELRGKLKKEQEEKALLITDRDIAKRDAQLLAMFPSKRSSMLSDDDRLTLLKKRYEFTVDEDGKEAVKDLKTGKFIQNETLENLGYSAVLEKHFTDTPGWLDAEGGGGGDGGKATGAGFKDSKKIGGAINNMREFKKHAEEQGWNLNGQEAQAKLAEITTANKDFNFNEV